MPRTNWPTADNTQLTYMLDWGEHNWVHIFCIIIDCDHFLCRHTFDDMHRMEAETAISRFDLNLLFKTSYNTVQLLIIGKHLRRTFTLFWYFRTFKFLLLTVYIYYYGTKVS